MNKIILFSFICTLATVVNAAIIQWTGPGSNGHYYELINVVEGIDWDSAKTQAENLTLEGLTGWHLATITSPEETTFINANLLPDVNDDVWLGGFQPPDSPEPNGNWQWVTGELWDYTDWFGSEPTNSLGNENVLMLNPAYNGQWNDAQNTSLISWYIAEVPEPATMFLLGLGGLALLRKRRA